MLLQYFDRQELAHASYMVGCPTYDIGMIALAGIVVRNSVVLSDFIFLAQANGRSLEESIIRSVPVRTQPILLAAGITLLANRVTTLDPVFFGLAWAIILGILTLTRFTLIVIPAACWLSYRSEQNEELASNV